MKTEVTVGDIAGEGVAADVEDEQAGDLRELPWDGAKELVEAQIQPRELGEIPQARRNRAGEAVGLEGEDAEILQEAQLVRDAPGQLVVAELQHCRNGKVGRYQVRSHLRR